MRRLGACGTLLALVFAALLFAGCGRSGGEEQETVMDSRYAYSDDDVYIYSAVKYELPLKENQYIQTFHAAEDGLYYVILDESEEDFENRIYKVDYERLTQADSRLKEEYGCMYESSLDLLELSEDVTPEEFLHIFISNLYCADGKIFILNKTYDGDENRYECYLYCQDGTGNAELVCDISEGYNEAVRIARERLDNAGHSVYDAFFVQETEAGPVLVLGFHGGKGAAENITFAIDSGNGVVQVCDYEISEDRSEQADGGIYALRENSLVWYDGEWREEMEPDRLGRFDGAVSAFQGIVRNSLEQQENGLRLCLYNDDGIFRLDQNEYRQTVKWSDMGLSWRGLNAKSIIQYGDEHFIAAAMFTDSGYVIDMTWSGIADGEKEEFIVGTLRESEELSRIVRIFNASNGRYEAKIRVYDSVESLNTELIAGNGPDVFPSDMVDIREYAAAGIIEDLGKYLDSGEAVLTRDMLFENILELVTFDGVLVTVPARFSIHAYAGRKDVLGSMEGWTAEELIERLEGEPERTVYDYGFDTSDTAYHIAWMLFQSMRESFVDWQSYTAYFDTEEFIGILEFLKTYESPGVDRTLSQKEKLDAGRTLVVSEQIVDIETVMNWNKEGQYRFIGYPSEDGEAAYGINISKSYSMNANSSHKEAAWKFIQDTVLSSAYDDVAIGWIIGFPVAVSKFEDSIDLTGKFLDPNYAADEESVNELMYMIGHARYLIDGNRDSVMIILQEEITTMLESGRPAEDTARIIQERVQIYLDERR